MLPVTSQPATGMSRVALIGCCAAKLDRPAPACEFYTSQLFRSSIAWALAHCDHAFVVSALHGLVELDAKLSPYNRRVSELGNMRERDAWGERTIGRLASKLAGQSVTPVLLLSEGYARHLRAPLRRRTADWMKLARGRVDATPWGDVEEPLRGLRIGQRLAWLNRVHDAAASGVRS